MHGAHSVKLILLFIHARRWTNYLSYLGTKAVFGKIAFQGKFQLVYFKVNLSSIRQTCLTDILRNSYLASRHSTCI